MFGNHAACSTSTSEIIIDAEEVDEEIPKVVFVNGSNFKEFAAKSSNPLDQSVHSVSDYSRDTDSCSEYSDSVETEASSHQYSKPASIYKDPENWRKLSNVWKIAATIHKNSEFPDYKNDHLCTKLYHTKRKILKLKNYHDNARSMRDIGKFLAQPIVLFKIQHSQWEDIVEEMVTKLSKEKPELNISVRAAMKSVISKDADYLIPECVQGITPTLQGPVTEQSFIVVIGNTNAVVENQVVMCILKHPFNFGNGAEEIRFICLVLSPKKTKHTKSGIQVARTYATLLSDDRLRYNLLNTKNPEEFAHEFEMECHRMHKEHEKRQRAAIQETKLKNTTPEEKHWVPVRDFVDDVKRRARHYALDYCKDARDCTSILKITSTTLFLFFSLLLPSIAFGVLDANYTDGRIDAKNVIVSQALAGVLWALFGGQYLVVIRTTIPVVIYTKIIYMISKNWADDGSFFYTFYALTGLSNAVFLVIYGLTGVSKIMAYCSRSTEEIVGLFISIAFIVDSIKYILKEFDLYYYSCSSVNVTTSILERASDSVEAADCDQSKPLLSLLLLLVTVYVGVLIFNFKYSPYLTAAKRVMVADYALVVAVAVGAILGSYVFRHIDLGTFYVNEKRATFEVTKFQNPSAGAVVAAIGLGCIMSILFFMEGNISASIVNNPSNKLKRGPAYHYDMVVTGVVNAVMSVLCLPFVHGSLPHSPLHVRALADIEEHIESGNVSEKIVYVRETRLPTLIAHVLIGLSVLLVPYPLNMIPIPVLYGLFIFLAITSLGDFQLWERLVLIFTEQSLYPPIHYVRKVPQKIIHFFTFLQIVQLLVLCLISFAGSAYLKMFFPFAIIVLMPIRQRVLPAMISERHLHWLDGEH